MADFDSAREMFYKVRPSSGPIDILVNNAGITRDSCSSKMTRADWVAVINTNLNSVFNVTQQVMDGMVERGWGRIVNISSVNGERASSARPTTRRPRPACTASPRRWRRRSPRRA